MKLEYHESLQSSVKMNEEHPNTFWVPEEEARNNLKPGECTKVTLSELPKIGETFWVEVLAKIEKDGKIFYLGSVENDLLYYNFKCKDLIIFGPDHVRQNGITF